MSTLSIYALHNGKIHSATHFDKVLNLQTIKTKDWVLIWPWCVHPYKALCCHLKRSSSPHYILKRWTQSDTIQAKYLISCKCTHFILHYEIYVHILIWVSAAWNPIKKSCFRIQELPYLLQSLSDYFHFFSIYGEKDALYNTIKNVMLEWTQQGQNHPLSEHNFFWDTLYFMFMSPCYRATNWFA